MEQGTPNTPTLKMDLEVFKKIKLSIETFESSLKIKSWSQLEDDYKKLCNDICFFGIMFPESTSYRAELLVLFEKAKESYVNSLKTYSKLKTGALCTAGGVAAGALAVASIPVVLGVLGFGSSGVVGGSVVAGIQSVWYGGFTSGLFSVCQSIGAAGLSTTTIVGVPTVGGGIGAAIGSSGTPEVSVPEIPSTFSWESNIKV